MFGDPVEMRVLAVDCPECCRGGGENVDFVLGDDAPECCSVGSADRLPFEEDCCRADEERRVQDVCVPDDPAKVAGAKDGVFSGLDVEKVLDGVLETDEMAANRADDAFRLTGRAYLQANWSVIGRTGLEGTDLPLV